VRKYPLGEETLWDDREAVGAESLGVERIQAALKHDSKASSSFDEGAAGIIASQLEACLITTALTLVQACFKITRSRIKRQYISNSRPLPPRPNQYYSLSHLTIRSCSLAFGGYPRSSEGSL
jgi:hypothetical protein